MDDQDLPKSRLVRLGKLAALGARTGASLIASRDGSGAAESATRVLGQMRGLAAKVGQMASYVDGIVPEAHRDAFESTLAKLRSAAPTSTFAAVKRTVEEDLGQPLDRLFASFEESPFASASIGQVHRATLEDGRVVAVKVQHEGIRDAVEADLSNAAVLSNVAGVAGGAKVGAKAIFERVRTRFREELDYRIEARHLTTFREFHAGDPTIRVPELISHRSGPRVLTTELVHGHSFERAITASEPERRAYVETLWRFVFRGNLVLGLFNADPHPGNYLFGEDGVVTFLDFGCCEPLDGTHQSAARRMHAAAIRRDEAAFRENAKVLLETKPGDYEDFSVGYARRCFEPLFASPFHLTRSYAAALVEGAQEAKRLMLRRGANVTPLPPNMVLVNRLQFGFYSVLARFDVEADYGSVERAFLTREEWGRALF